MPLAFVGCRLEVLEGVLRGVDAAVEVGVDNLSELAHVVEIFKQRMG